MDAESSPLILSASSDYLSTRPPSFIQSHRTASLKEYQPSIRNTIALWCGQTLSFIISSLFLVLVVGWALLCSIPDVIRRARKEPEVFEWDGHAKYHGKERNTKNVRYYAQEAGFDIVDEVVETEDGFLLRWVWPFGSCVKDLL